MSNEYAEYRKQFLIMLRELQFMRDGQLGQINIAKHPTEPTAEDTQPKHSASYRTGLKVKNFEKPNIDKMSLQKVIKPNQTERVPSIVFVSM